VDRFERGLRLVSSVTRAFVETAFDLPRLLDTIARETAAAVPDLCIVSLVSDDRWTPVAMHDDDPEAVAVFAPTLQRVHTGGEVRLAEEVIATGTWFYPELDFAALASTMTPEGLDRFRAIGARGMIVAPLCARGGMLGVMSVVRHRAELPPLDEVDREVADAIASHAAFAIDNARLFANLERSEQLRTAEEKVVETSRMLDAIVENIPDMIFVKEALALSFVRFNKAGESLLGLSREQLIGRSDFDFFPRHEAEFFVAKDRETLATRALVDIAEEPIQTPRGTRWLHTKKVPIIDASGEPRYLLGISEDITDRKRTEHELRAAKAATEAANKELQAFAYSVAHDLRAPLRGIDGFAQALLEDYGERLDGDGRRYLARVRESAQRMAELIDDLLALSRVTRDELRRRRVDLGEVAADVVAHLRRHEPERRVDVAIAEGLIVDADPRMMTIVLENLLGNAWKFTSTRADARIAVERVGRALCVRDNGAGFDMQFRHKLFGVFQRLHSEHEFPGTGIGLATVARIVERHGGRVWAEGQVGVGASFYLELGEP
jgi:PAS domain S-box-containing protein